MAGSDTISPDLSPKSSVEPSAGAEVVPYDEGWFSRFEATRRDLVDCFEGARVEHIGSTSVPGLAADDTIDIAVGVPDVAAALDADRLAALGALGFEHLPEAFADNPDHAFLRRVVRGRRADHVHVLRLGSTSFEERLLLRDFLIAQPDVAAEYQDAKLDLARRCAGRAGYGEEKSLIVDQLMGHAREWAAGRALPPRPRVHRRD